MAALRVGWCPGALRPMASGDGLIVRIKPRGATLSCAAAIGIAAAAARYGNGALDLTARANLQIRGVSDDALPGLTRALDAIGLLDADAEAESRRNVVASPLAGLDPTAAFDIRAAVAALEEALASATTLADLPNKFGFAVSDGGALPLGGGAADVLFEAIDGGRFAIHLDGGGETAATCSADALPDAALRLARVFDAARRANPDLHRMRDLVRMIGTDEVLRQVASASTPSTTLRVVPRSHEGEETPPAVPHCVGPIDLGRDGRVVLGVAAAFGRLEAEHLDGLARGAERAGAVELRLTPWRTILVPGLGREAAAVLAARCAAMGLIVDPADPRLRVAACVGVPGCRRATTPVLEQAADWAGLLGPGDGSRGIALHVSGCVKGCAHPTAAPLTLVAEGGRYAMVAEGTAAAPPSAVGLDAQEVPQLLKTILRQDRPT